MDPEFRRIPDIQMDSEFPRIPDTQMDSEFPRIPDTQMDSEFPRIPDMDMDMDTAQVCYRVQAASKFTGKRPVTLRLGHIRTVAS